MKIRAISLALLLSMLIGMFGITSASASAEVGGAAVSDPLSAIDNKSYIVWRYESADSISNASAAINAYVTKDGTRTTEMTYTADPKYGVKCAATVCEPVGGALGLGNHRITTCFVGNNKLTVDLNYVAVTYLTVSAEKHGLTFRNTGGAGAVTLTDDTSVSGGKWVTVYAPVTGSEKTNIVTRMNKSFGNMGLMWNGAMGTDETLYVREIVFFKDEADVKAYAAGAPAYYNSGSYVAPKEEPKTEPEVTPEEKPVVGVTVTQTASATSVMTDPLNAFGASSYIAWRYTSADSIGNASATINAYVTKDGTRTTEMNYTTDPKFGVKCAATVCEPVGGALGLGNHRITTCFVGNNKLTVDLNYIAVTYLTDSTEKHGLVFRNTAGSGSVTLTDDTSVSGGRWVVSYVPVTGTNKANMIARLNKSFGNMVLIWDGAVNADEPLYVREVVFFKDEADVKAYASAALAYYNAEGRNSDTVTIKIGETSLENYKIVIAEDANKTITEAAEALNGGIAKIIGKKLEVVSDDTPASDHEILLGNTNRTESAHFYGLDAVYGAAGAADVSNEEYSVKVVGNKLVIASAITLGVKSAVNDFVKQQLQDELFGEVALTSEFSMVGTPSDYSSMKPVNKYATRVNDFEPTVFTEDFSEDKGYFTEEEDEDNWKYENGAYVAKASDSLALSYIHVYEYNAAFEADISYSGAVKNKASMGITLRYTGEHGYIRAGYDFTAGEWYIDLREGYDFDRFRVASKKAAVTADTVCRLAATVDGDLITLAVNGAEVISATVSAHRTPGRVGVYALGANVTVDNVKLTQLSGEGTILRYVDHTILRKDATYDEGATPLVMNDGSIIITRSPSLNFKSLDGGRTWQSTEKWVDYTVCPSFLRLANGSWMKLNAKSVNGVNCMVAEVSADDGKTWTDAGTICTVTHAETGKTVGNMNDKLTQVRSGRIFASMTYNGGDASVWNNFIIFYYSDDNGVTWHESLDTRNIEGHSVTRDENGVVANRDPAKYFAEAKIIQCADGRVRMLSTWNNYTCMVYCDSFDNGITWGPIQRMTEFTCNRSSFAIARDLTAENDTTYYMVWCYDTPLSYPDPLPRTRLALARSTDGMNWEFLGDVWRWESADRVGPNPHNGNCTLITQIVDPAINVTADNVIICSGISEYAYGYYTSYHQATRQNVWTVAKDTLPEGKSISQFLDVPVGASYNEAISYVAEKGYFTGLSDTSFAPYTIMNRAMFVTVLGRLEGIDTKLYRNVSFTDVVKGLWSAAYIEWAATNGVVSGMGDGTFRPDDEITVQQACLMLYRYANGKTAAQKTGLSVADFADSASVAAWAKDGVEWAIANGVYNGQNGKISATDPASRALVATMFKNYVTVIGK